MLSRSTSSRAALADADVVVASTSAPGFVLRRDELAATLRARRGRPLLLVDLAVPRDVDPALAAIDGCFVYDVDDLEAVVAASLAGRRTEAVQAERIVAEEAERFRAWQASLAVVPAIASLRARAEEIRAAELARIEARLGRLPEGDRDVVDTVTAQIVNKLLHLPTVRMKEAAVTPDGLLYADVVRHLFGLGEESESVTRPSSWLRSGPCRSSSRPRSFASGRGAAAPAGSGDADRPPLPCCFASARAAVGSRSPRPSARPRRCDGPGSRSRSFRSRPRATATGRGRSARSAAAASSSRSSRRRSSRGGSTSPSTRRRT